MIVIVKLSEAKDKSDEVKLHHALISSVAYIIKVFKLQNIDNLYRLTKIALNEIHFDSNTNNLKTSKISKTASPRNMLENFIITEEEMIKEKQRWMNNKQNAHDDRNILRNNDEYTKSVKTLKLIVLESYFVEEIIDSKLFNPM